MALNVNESRCHHEPGRIDVAARGDIHQHAARRNTGDAVATNADVAVEPGIPRAVDDAAPGDDDIVSAVVAAPRAHGRARRE
jgi:hypothetical protein